VKIFFIGMPRCGTKSFSTFLKQNNFKVLDWEPNSRNEISAMYFSGKLNDLINTKYIKDHEVFEDSPFFHPHLAKFISNYISDSYFVYFYRPAEDWYISMLKHSDGKTFENLKEHAYTYDRMEELDFLDKNYHGDVNIKSLSMIGLKDHYIRQYEKHKLKIFSFFKDDNFDKSRFFSASLYDEQKFQKMSNHFNLNCKFLDDVKVHESRVTLEEVIKKHENDLSSMTTERIIELHFNNK